MRRKRPGGSKRWTRIALAKEAGVSRQTIYSILEEKADPQDQTITDLARALGVPPPSLSALETGSGDNPDLAEISADEEYQPEGPGFQWDRTDYTQITDDEVLELLVQDPRGFLRFLMSTYEQRAPISLRAKLDYLDFIESIAKEKGVPIPTERLETYRQLVRQRHF